ncbi:MAG: metallophosphoesterase [Bacteroidetes bacterium]|nr:metallophosphoesterase [Bacteroidota bacterium]
MVFKFFLLLIFLLVDWYFFSGVQVLIKDLTPPRKSTIQIAYWVLSALTIFLLILTFSVKDAHLPVFFRSVVVSILFVLFISKFLGCLILLIDDMMRLFRWGFQYAATIHTPEKRTGISRLQFFGYTAAGLFSLSFVSLLYGVVKGAKNFKTHRVKLSFKNLPKSFSGLKIVQISDIHTGSFADTSSLQQAFDKVMELKPDVIFFTGDLVNDKATETEGFLPLYQQLKAPMGVYSILGNHDYGDYAHWESGQAKRDNLNALKNIHAQAGWRLLINEHVVLEKNNEQIALLGIENWGGNLHFPKYGRMDLAHRGTEKYPFKILLSHDPSHWDKQVKESYKDIDLTLSGHTHGAQFGVEIPGYIKWSPSKYFYKQWAGLYNKENQFLYVNRGLGCVGREHVPAYNGRLGIWPEITYIELLSV